MYLVFILLCLLLLVGVGWIATALVSKSRTPVAAAASAASTTPTGSPFLQGPRGPQGARGLAGVAGPVGPTGPTVKTYNGQYVVIQHRPNGNKTPVHAAEIQVFAFIEGREIALPLNAGTLQPAEESCAPVQHPWNRSPEVRGLKSYALFDDENLSTYVTTSGTTDSESIRIDLLREFPISRVVIYNRQDCCQERLNECDLQIRDANDRLVYTQAFPTPAQKVYIFV